MTGRRVDFYFKQLDGATGIVAEVRRLAAVDQLCRDALPPSLRPFFNVGAYRNGRIKIYATTGAAAAKLRQISPRISAALRERGLEVTGIDLQVQPGPGKSPTPPGPRRVLSKEAINDLESLQAALGPSPLRDAIERLLRRAVKAGDDHFSPESHQDDA